MLKNIWRKSIDTEYRLIILNLIKWCLVKFKETGDEEYLKHATEYGEISKKLKKELS